MKTTKQTQRKLQETIFQVIASLFLIWIPSYLSQGMKLNRLEMVGEGGGGMEKKMKREESNVHICKTTINKQCSVAALLNR